MATGTKSMRETELKCGVVAAMTRREAIYWSALFGLLTVVLRIPFVLRYDLYFQSAMAVEALQCKRLWHGEFSIYTWATDYGGVAPQEFLFSLLFALFGFSVPLASFFTLVVWSIGVGLLVGYVAVHFGRREAIGAGIALAIGVPFFHMYCTQYFGSTYDQTTLLLGGFIWLAALVVRQGPNSRLSVVTALLMGWCWYMYKQVLIIWISIFVALLLVPQGRAFLSRFLRSKMALFAVIAFLAGYSPEILYKLGFFDHEGRHHDTARFFSMAPPDLMARNWYMLFRCIPTYFNADPWSRDAEGVHYLNHMENWESVPLHASDTVGIIAAFLVIGYALRMLVRGCREKDLSVLLLTCLPVVNAIMIVVAGRSEAAYYNIRRYLLPSGVLFMVWLGIRLSREMAARRWAVPGVLGLMLLISVFQQAEMLRYPDQLADHRRTIEEIEKNGYKYGLSWYSYSATLTALCDERVIFGVVDYSIQNPYQRRVLEQDMVVVVWPAKNPPPFEFAQQLFFGGVRFRDDTVRLLPERVSFFDQDYARIGEPQINGELGWAPYRKGAGRPSPVSH